MADVRLIDANALVKVIESIHCKDCNNCNGAMCRACTWMDAMDYIEDAPTIEAQPVKHGNWNVTGEYFDKKKRTKGGVQMDEAHWTDTDETVWEARNKDSGEEFEISIVSAKCSVCGRWAEQVNAFPPYIHYEYCPHCSRKME